MRNPKPDQKQAARLRERALRAFREAGFVVRAVLLVEYHDRPDRLFYVEQVREYDMAVRGLLSGGAGTFPPGQDWIRLDDVLGAAGPLISNVRGAAQRYDYLERDVRLALRQLTESRRRVRFVGANKVFR